MFPYSSVIMLDFPNQNLAYLYKTPTMHPIAGKLAFNFISKVRPSPCAAVLKFSSKAITNPQNLPHFPVPPLEQTIEKFTKTCEVHLSPLELEKTKSLLKDFQNGVGLKLQSLLERQSQKEENWLASRWLKTAYLSYRDPVCVFSSPGMAFPTQKFSSDEAYLRYTARLIHGALNYKLLIDLKSIPVEKMGKKQLDMSQYEKVFGTCRIPGLHEDSLEYNPDSKHIVVVVKNNFYKMPVYTKDGLILNVETIYEQIKGIVSNNDPWNDDAIGVLTSEHRDTWGLAYNELLKNDQNRLALKEIQKSLFVVCLDQEVPVVHDSNEMTVVSEQLIHGGGSKQNAGNRWFDKTIQVVVNRNGVNGLCYEHSPAEGQPIAIMTDFIIKSFANPVAADKNETGSFETAEKLSFNLSSETKEFIKNAKNNVDKLSSNLHMQVLHFKDYGREFIKTQKLSPDSYLQMAMQYAFYRMHRTPAAHYESAHLRLYINGRTETIRSCSNESVAFAKSMVENKSDEERVDLLRQAVNSHRDYTMMALQGKGVDRHLLGLKLMALENNIPVPDLYKSEAFVRSAHFRLSTSQVASRYLAFMCYGPLVDNGYGCCYNPRANDMIFAVSSWRSNSETDTERFTVTLRESLQSMAELLLRAGVKPKAKL